MSDEPLTRRQREVLDFIKACHDKGSIPSLSKIGATFSISKGTAQKHVEAIVEKGFLTKEENGRIVIPSFQAYERNMVKIPDNS